MHELSWKGSFHLRWCTSSFHPGGATARRNERVELLSDPNALNTDPNVLEEGQDMEEDWKRQSP